MRSHTFRDLCLILFIPAWISLSSCASGPQVRVEVSTPAQGGVNWYDERTGKSGFSPYSDTDKHVCFPPQDLQTLMDYCGLSKSDAAKQLLEVIK